MKAKILWIEGKRADSPSFIPGLRKKEFHVETVPSGSAALERIADYHPDLVVVNAASLRTSGTRICNSIYEKANRIPIILITTENNLPSKDIGAKVVLSLPFTIRKLVNRIIPFVPGDNNNILHVGPIRLDMERNQVHCQNREKMLTPRLARLLQILMQHPGQVLERERLFREAWSTEYTGDTRTLDVHISWLRQAIEEDPRKPRFLKTIRRMGYRLDV